MGGVMSKYHNRKITVNGETFDSIKEYQRFRELQLLERAGEISDLRRQVPHLLIPAQYDGKKCVERECNYIADFEYLENGKKVVEDTKGYKTPEYIIKRKLMLLCYGIRIKEV